MNRVLPSFLLQRAIAGQMSAPLKARLNWPRSFQSESLVASDGVLEGVDTAIVASLVDAIANNVRVSRVRIEDSAQR